MFNTTKKMYEHFAAREHPTYMYLYFMNHGRVKENISFIDV